MVRMVRAARRGLEWCCGGRAGTRQEVLSRWRREEGMAEAGGASRGETIRLESWSCGSVMAGICGEVGVFVGLGGGRCGSEDTAVAARQRARLAW